MNDARVRQRTQERTHAGESQARVPWLQSGAQVSLLVTTDRTQNADARRGFGWVVDRARRERTAMPA
jgi:hypothetical protein